MLARPQLLTPVPLPAPAVVKYRAPLAPKITGRSRLAPADAPLFPSHAAGAAPCSGPPLDSIDEVILVLPSSVSPANGLNDAPTYKFVRYSAAEG